MSSRPDATADSLQTRLSRGSQSQPSAWACCDRSNGQRWRGGQYSAAGAGAGMRRIRHRGETMAGQVFRLIGLAAVVLWGAEALTPSRAQPQDYPSRPITILVGVAPGGITDVTTRVYAEVVSRSIGQRIVVENRPVGG